MWRQLLTAFFVPFSTSSYVYIIPQDVYPSDSFKDTYETVLPEVFAASVAATFVVVVSVFFVYDVMVKRRNEKLVTNAAQSNALVSSLFPGMFRDRVLDEELAREQSRMRRQQELLKDQMPLTLHRFDDEEM